LIPTMIDSFTETQIQRFTQLGYSTDFRLL
jgi:hypothetical protein